MDAAARVGGGDVVAGRGDLLRGGRGLLRGLIPRGGLGLRPLWDINLTEGRRSCSVARATRLGTPVGPRGVCRHRTTALTDDGAGIALGASDACASCEMR